ncbi:ribonucleotide reductase beta subunit family protein with ferritin-like domain [Bacillus chungangensis]|uniref:Ribonucleotide reductase beta subunit family protein with ferritin-like domain n=1 Tax=Bacillus chungangensis TaxID=587633 RepID=A0ABT9WQR0_9BACI|nr:ribonucleotide reductase beta subunit family protein with ferritin-like domain [Bacillus chungangensis]
MNALMIMLAQQEVIHYHSYSYVLSSLVSLQEQEEVFSYWKAEPILEKRNQFITNGYKLLH